jgi:gamma-glutamyl-gamma-aminobutyrate hydrolase PuuD
VTGAVTAVDGGGWQVDGSVKVYAADLTDIAVADYDGDGNTSETMAQEMDGLVVSGGRVSISYYQEPSFKVTGFSPA